MGRGTRLPSARHSSSRWRLTRSSPPALQGSQYFYYAHMYSVVDPDPDPTRIRIFFMNPVCPVLYFGWGVGSVADLDTGSGTFLTPGSGIRVESQHPDPG